MNAAQLASSLLSTRQTQIPITGTETQQLIQISSSGHLARQTQIPITGTETFRNSCSL